MDETGSHLGYTPTHAWAPRGQRAYATAPANRGENKTVVAALTLDGVGPRMRFDGAMTTDRFEGYVRFVSLRSRALRDFFYECTRAA